MKGGRNTEGYADPTATIAVGRVAKEEREQIECEAADKRAYDLIKVLKYIIKGAGFELTERVQVKDTKKGLQMNEIFTDTFDRWTWFPQMKPWELEVMSSNKKVQRMKDRQDRKVRLRNYGK